MRAAIIRTGVANVASVAAALERAGASCTLARGARDVARAEAVVLPGVGAFGAGVLALREGGLDGALRERIAAGAPTLAVCLGMQLMGEGSDEGPGRGLGVVGDRARALPRDVRPHLGWNDVAMGGEPGLLEGGAAYFAHSYAFTDPEAFTRDGWRVATAREGVPFVAAAERGAVLLCQLHPELSGSFGKRLLERWVRAAKAAEVTPW